MSLSFALSVSEGPAQAPAFPFSSFVIFFFSLVTPRCRLPLCCHIRGAFLSLCHFRGVSCHSDVVTFVSVVTFVVALCVSLSSRLTGGAERRKKGRKDGLKRLFTAFHVLSGGVWSTWTFAGQIGENMRKEYPSAFASRRRGCTGLLNVLFFSSPFSFFGCRYVYFSNGVFLVR